MKIKLISIVMLMILAVSLLQQPALAQTGGTPEGTPSPVEMTATPQLPQLTQAVDTTTPSTPPPPQTSNSGQRPVIVVNSYSVTDGKVVPGSRFLLTLNLCNNSPKKGDSEDIQRFARNVILNYSGNDFLPDTTGGLRATYEMDPQECLNIEQPFFAANTLWSAQFGSVQVTVNYTDISGSGGYSGTFNITIPIKGWGAGSGGVAAPTKTPTQVARPQLVISSFTTDVDPIQPGTRFQLKLSVSNVGSALARGVTMILGGGNAQDLATPGAGSTSTGDFSTFTPLGSSNIVVLGDIQPGSSVQRDVPLVVNVTATPGSYPLKMTFAYDIGGQVQASDQFISLQIYQLPNVDVTFGQPVTEAMIGNMVPISLQVNNLGKKSTILGMMTVESPNGTFTPASGMVGSLDPGGYYSLDTQFSPQTAGEAPIHITLNYLDDFNQPRTIQKKLSVRVTEMPTPEPMPTNPDGSPMTPNAPAQELTVWQKIGAFFRGLFGLDSSSPAPAGEMPSGGEGVEPGMDKPMPAPMQGGGGG